MLFPLIHCPIAVESPQSLLQAALSWVESLGAGGAIAYILLYAIATVLFLPGSVLTLGGGAIFDVVAGSIYVLAGAVVGATLAFLIGRYFLRDFIARRIEGNEQFKAVDRAIAQNGFKIVLLTRLSPVFPFNLLNYALGLTQVSLKDYLLGFVGMIPGTVMYVYIGAVAGSLAKAGSSAALSPQAQQVQWVIRSVGLMATIAVTLYVTRIARTALNESLSTGELDHVPPNDR